jgi:hypothetical protein
MKKLLLFSFLLCSLQTTFAQTSIQTNTFPENGAVGIGTLKPASLLHLRGGATRERLELQSDGNGSAYFDLQFNAIDNSKFTTGKAYSWLLSHRKDGYFSGSQAGGTSLEFYALRIGGGYFAPLSFSSTGDVVLVSGKNATAANVGIGTTTTSNGKLTVNGPNTQLRLENDEVGNEARMRLRTKNAGGQYLHADIALYANGNSAETGFLGFKVPANNTVGTGYSMVVNSDGKLGLGTVEPLAKLHVNGAGESVTIGDPNHTGQPALRFLGGYTNGFTYIQAGGAASPKLRFSKYSTVDQNLEDFQVYATESFFSGKMGIGVAKPKDPLHVYEAAGSSGTTLRLDAAPNLNPNMLFSVDGINYANIRVVDSEQDQLQFQTYNEGWVNAMSISKEGKVSIGTENPGTYKLAVNGDIKARKVNVTLEGWSDFVFEEDYVLRPLAEVEQFIKAHKHLPDVPSEAEVLEEGVELGEMNSRLLQKIEELTLYTIQQEKVLEKQQEKLIEKEGQFAELLKRMELLEQQLKSQ